jgi:beta-carotene 3-hydroxylase
MNWLAVAVTFVLMEPATYATHRWVMHGHRGMRLHGSHHRRDDDGGWELNDWFPVAFATTGAVLAAAGASIGPLSLLLPVSVGAGLYGLAYGFVHDVYIHGRLPWLTGREVRVLEWMKASHRIHHLFGGEPYGMLLPIVPSTLRARASRVARDPLSSIRA